MIINSIDTDKEVLLIAEVGNNHEGNFENARTLVRKAAECGVHAVKFQTFRTGLFVRPTDAARFARLQSFELTFEQFSELSRLAHSLGLLFISTPLDLVSARFLEEIVDAFKIASSDNNFYPLLDQVSSTGKPLIISTGVSDYGQISHTVKFVQSCWQRQHIQGDLALLHCLSSYPVPPDQVNLRSIKFIHDHFDCTPGYSDHTMGIEAAVAAVGLGARIIEKHFTLDHHFSDFRDHQLSADPPEMMELASRIKLVDSMLGDYLKGIQPCEKDMAQAIRRSIAARIDLPAGHILTWDDLAWLRPAAGLPPGEESRLLGKTLKRDHKAGESILEGDVA